MNRKQLKGSPCRKPQRCAAVRELENLMKRLAALCADVYGDAEEQGDATDATDPTDPRLAAIRRTRASVMALTPPP